MLDIPSRAATAEPEAAADPYAWVDPGERWVKEPRNLAPALDSFLTHAHRLGAEQVMFSTFQPASFRLWGLNRKVKSRDPLDENDASLIVNHLYGADGIARLQGGADINVMYQIGSPRKGTLRFRCNVTAITASRGAGAHVVIRPVRDLPQPLSSQNVEPEILAHYRMTKGMMIVSGATGSGKSTLIGAMTVEKLRDPDAHLNIIECAEPVEFLLDRLESPTSSISQSEIPRNVKSFEEFMAGAMRRQPTDIIIGECRKPEHMIATIQAAISGHATATTIHAETVPLTMQRVASLLPPGFGVDLRQLAPHGDGLARIELHHRLGEQRDGLGIARRRLERALQPGERQARVLARDVGGGQLARDGNVVGTVEQQAFGDAHELVATPLQLELIGGLGELLDRLGRLTRLRGRLGEANPRDDIVRVELDHPPQRRQRIRRTPSLLELGHRQLQLVQGVRHHAELAVGLAQLHANLRQPGRELEDTLVDGDRLRQEPLTDVDLGGTQVDLAGFGQGAVPDVDLRHLEPGSGVAGILLDHATKLLQSPVVLPALQKLLSCG